MKKTYIFSNENGVFISFLDYEGEDEFEMFLGFVCRKLGVPIPLTTASPYSPIAEFKYANTPLIASYNTDAGCYLHILPGSQLSAELVVEQCYGTAIGV